MKMNLKHIARVMAIMVAIGISGASVQAFQDQNPDYSKNKTYQQGMREGKDDQAHKLDHSKKRRFAKDEDQNAYEAGYQHGHDNK